MGITIHYRGKMDDLGQIETLEDRILDFVYAMGGRGTIWRSFADHDPSRVVRGLMIDLEPGHDTFSLLISPDGDLTPLFQIEDAEKGPFDESPDCFVKTQFGSLQGHITIVHLLDAIKQQFCSNLHVSDESEYYEKRDINQLAQKMKFLRATIRSMGESLREHGLSEEAAEDPIILTTRIERIAALVRQKILAEHSSAPKIAQNSSENNWSDPSLEDEVNVMDKLERQDQLRSERMARRIAECTAAGMSAKEAFEVSMREEGLQIPRDENETDDERYGVNEDELWLESSTSHPFDIVNQQVEHADYESHPSVDQAETFLMTIADLTEDNSKKSNFRDVLFRAAMDIAGGLAQATGDESEDVTSRALTITQLKRALTAHAYARGAVFGLRSEDAITQAEATELHAQLAALLNTIHELAESAWSASNE